MNKTRFALDALYFTGLLTAGTVLLTSPASGQSKPHDVKKAINIIKDEGRMTPDDYGIQYHVPYTEGYTGLSQIVYEEMPDGRGMFSVNFAEQEGEYIKVFTVIDYGKMKPNGKGDGKPDGLADKYFAVKIKESDILKMFLSGDKDMEKHIVSQGDSTPETQKIYDSAITYLIKK